MKKLHAIQNINRNYCARNMLIINNIRLSSLTFFYYLIILFDQFREFMTVNDSEQFSSPDIEAFQSMKLLDSNDYQGAIQKCHEAISRFGPNRNCYLVKARAHILQEEYGFAEKALQSVLQIDPEHPGAWAMLGEIYYRLGREPKVEYCRSRLEYIFPALAESFDQNETEPQQENKIEHEKQPETDAAETPRATPEMKTESIVPLEDLDNKIEKQDKAEESYYESEPKTEENQDELTARADSEQGQTDGLKPELFETATFADICFNQGKYEKAFKVYKKLLIDDPDNSKYKEKLKIIESKIGMQ